MQHLRRPGRPSPVFDCCDEPFLGPGPQKPRSAKIPVCKNPGLQKSRSAKIPVCKKMLGP
jgi:hypothetical protein